MTTKTRKTPDDTGVKTAQEALEAMMATGRETMETMLKASVETATESYEKAVAFGKGQGPESRFQVSGVRGPGYAGPTLLTPGT